MTHPPSHEGQVAEAGLLILSSEAKRRGVSVADIIRYGKHRRVSAARQAVFARLHDELGWPKAVIARVMRRDRRCVQRGIAIHNHSRILCATCGQFARSALVEVNSSPDIREIHA